MLTAVGSLDTSLSTTVVKNSLKVSATFNLAKVVEPLPSKPIEIEPDFSLDEVSRDFSVFKRSHELIFMIINIVIIKMAFSFSNKVLHFILQLREMYKIISNFTFSEIM